MLEKSTKTHVIRCVLGHIEDEAWKPCGATLGLFYVPQKQQGKMMPDCMLPPRGNIVPWYQNKPLTSTRHIRLTMFGYLCLVNSNLPLFQSKKCTHYPTISCFQSGLLKLKPWGWHLHSWTPLKLIIFSCLKKMLYFSPVY